MVVPAPEAGSISSFPPINVATSAFLLCLYFLIRIGLILNNFANISNVQKCLFYLIIKSIENLNGKFSRGIDRNLPNSIEGCLYSV